MLGKTEVRRRGQQSLRCLDDIINSMDMSLSKLREIVKDREAWPSTVRGFVKSGHHVVTEQPQKHRLRKSGS